MRGQLATGGIRSGVRGDQLSQDATRRTRAHADAHPIATSTTRTQGRSAPRQTSSARARCSNQTPRLLTPHVREDVPGRARHSPPFTPAATRTWLSSLSSLRRPPAVHPLRWPSAVPAPVSDSLLPAAAGSRFCARCHLDDAPSRPTALEKPPRPSLFDRPPLRPPHRPRRRRSVSSSPAPRTYPHRIAAPAHAVQREPRLNAITTPA